MKRISIAAIVLLALAVALAARGDGAAPGSLDLDEALARQAATDLIEGAAIAYDCRMMLCTFRRVGTDDDPVYLVEVRASGTECDDALLLLARHGSDRNLVFRRRDLAPDMHEIAPPVRGD